MFTFGVAVAVFVVLMTFVLPRFADMFQTLGAPLPPTTRFVMAVGEAFGAAENVADQGHAKAVHPKWVASGPELISAPFAAVNDKL